MTPSMPLGYIVESIPDGVIIDLARHDDHRTVKPGQPITIHNMSDNGAYFKARGRVTEVSRTTASLMVEEQEKDVDWPTHIDPMGRDMPVYAALPDSYYPDPSRVAMPWEFEILRERAEAHNAATGLPTSGKMYLMGRFEREELDQGAPVC